MKVIVCVKQVPDTGEMKIDPQTNLLVRDNVPTIINPFDEYAIEEGIRIKERVSGAQVAVLSMGPPKAQDALKEAIARGIDEATLLTDEALKGSDTFATAYALGLAIRKMEPFNLVICGKQSSDGATGQVAAALAEFLGVPYLAFVRKIRHIAAESIEVERLIEGGYEVVSAPLPAVISVVKEINEPRLPALKGIMKAKKTPVTQWSAADIGADPGRLGLGNALAVVEKTWTPESRGKCELIEGDPEGQARTLLARLKEAKLL